jgi:glyoxylase-like metal-dependent hydrolase (beta-lactamase superfamily II)
MVSTVDLGFVGRPGVIAAGVLQAPQGLVLVDPGPASTLGVLRDAVRALGGSLDDVRAILVTHIHLDHSGGVGALLRDVGIPDVYVHERGAPHIVDPSKLAGSAARLWGSGMERLWGEIVPVPAERVHAVRGGEVLRIAGLEFEVAYTPGHASHHVSYLETSTGTAFVGDTGGIRIGEPVLVVPPTPPPDIDVEAWDASLDRIRAWQPTGLFITHFGSFGDPEAHLADLQERLHESSGFAHALIADDSLDDDQRGARFAERMMGVFESRLPDAGWVLRYTTAVPVDHCWQGLLRYWRKRSDRASTGRA